MDCAHVRGGGDDGTVQRTDEATVTANGQNTPEHVAF